MLAAKELSLDSGILRCLERGIRMQQDLRTVLKSLTVAQLKSVAREHGIDVSSCTNKKSYVNTLSASRIKRQEIKATLDKLASEQAKASEEMKTVHDDLEKISSRENEPKSLSDSEGMDIERSIDRALLLRPLFFEIDSVTEHAWNKMILGDFSEALKLNMQSRNQVIEKMSSFHLYSTALSLRASETLLREIKGLEGEVASDLKTALTEAKKAFMNGPPKRREESLEEVEMLVAKAVEAFIEKSHKAELELKQMLQEYASFGVRIEGAAEMLEIAANAWSSKDYGQYSSLLNEAKILADREKEARMKEFESTFEQVRSAIDAAKEAGVDTKDDEAQFRNARKAFKDSDFRKAITLLAAIEQAADSAHLQKVREDDGAEAREMQEIATSMNKAEPDLKEAAMYGMDVQEGLLFVKQTRTALERRDVVGAAKYSRRVRRLTKAMKKDMKRLRAEKGILKHLEDGKCGECGKKSLYLYPDGMTRCDECGHAFSTSRDVNEVENDAGRRQGRLKGLLGR